jgi:hypothetical protein
VLPDTELRRHITTNLAFLHTSPVHVGSFVRLAAELCPDIPLAQVVDEELLKEARREGITPVLELRIGELLDALVRDRAAVIVCTCSTIGGCVEEVARRRSASAGRPGDGAAGGRLGSASQWWRRLASNLAPDAPADPGGGHELLRRRRQNGDACRRAVRRRLLRVPTWWTARKNWEFGQKRAPSRWLTLTAWRIIRRIKG